jgi:hypothetical protein
MPTKHLICVTLESQGFCMESVEKMDSELLITINWRYLCRNN